MQPVLPWTQIDRNEAGWLKRRCIKTLLIAGFVLCLSGLLSLVKPWFYFAFNLTDSLGGYLYLVLPGNQPGLGQKAAFQTPSNRFYPSRLWFVKIVRGVEGDQVSAWGRAIYLNDDYIGWARPYASNGEPLEPIKETVIPKDHYFLWTPHGRSFDSRYRDIGLVHKDAFIGTAYRLL